MPFGAQRALLTYRHFFLLPAGPYYHSTYLPGYLHSRGGSWRRLSTVIYSFHSSADCCRGKAWPTLRVRPKSWEISRDCESGMRYGCDVNRSQSVSVSREAALDSKKTRFKPILWEPQILLAARAPLVYHDKPLKVHSRSRASALCLTDVTSVCCSSNQADSVPPVWRVRD